MTSAEPPPPHAAGRRRGTGVQVAGSVLAGLLLIAAVIWAVLTRLGPDGALDREEREQAEELREEQAEEARERRRDERRRRRRGRD